MSTKKYDQSLISRRSAMAGMAGGLLAAGSLPAQEKKPVRRLLYVATPGIRNYLEYGGHGLVVLDIDAGHKFVKRIPLAGFNAEGKPDNVKGVCANARLGMIFVSTTRTLQAVNLKSEKLAWERSYEGGCDRMSMDPGGRFIYLPSFEKDHWHVVEPLTGDILAKITPKSGAHNTIVGLDGRHAYLAGLKSPNLTVCRTDNHTVEKTVGPFAAPIRPFTVNGRQTRAYVCVNSLLGFEIGDIETGKKLHRVEVPGFKQGPVKRHGCPSHGIGLTPDETEVWVVDAFNQKVHVFDITTDLPKFKESLSVRDEPGWVTFTVAGDYAYPSTGDVFDVKPKKLLTQLADEKGGILMSEKIVEIHVDTEGGFLANGDQFGLGRKFGI
ncbi:MAG: YncE family protein [Isosphaeraceae bacterium]